MEIQLWKESENIDKAKLGDPSGFMECIEVNYAN